MQGSSDEHGENLSDSESLGATEKRLILAAALIQGLSLYALKYFDAVDAWSPVWQYLCYTLAVAIPALVIVTIAPRLARGYWLLVAGYMLLLALLAMYRGYQCTPASLVYCGWPHGYETVVGIATFIVAFLLRACATGVEQLQRPQYPALFHFSWDNALTIGLTLVFTGIFWLILFLWQALFKLVGVGFFRELFEKDWFIYPVTWLVAGCGAILFRSQPSFVLTLKRLLRTMLVALLPLLAVLTIVFLATLPFTGLQPIWDTGRGSALLLWLLALLLFFTNGVIQDEFPFARYPTWINRILLLALIVAPLYGAFAVYGLWLRIAQYGWTPERLWGFVVALTLFMLAAAYCISILRTGGHWAGWLRRINTGLALWVLAVCIVTHSPLANFWRISADSQVARLRDGRMALADFDFYFLRRNLGREGLEALREVQTLPVVKQSPEISDYVDRLLAVDKNSSRQLRKHPLSDEKTTRRLHDIPVLPDGSVLVTEFDAKHEARDCVHVNRNCLWLIQDLDGDGTSEYLLFLHTTRRDDNNWLKVSAFSKTEGKWRNFASDSREVTLGFTELQQQLRQQSPELRPSRWHSLYLGHELLFDPTE
ncbi:DUF4153 domain-containing protein [Microbulbifer bruguierae]|uniref:DUF4153 domain-containing protein n=1 Tax=Microbulbifer bruguierae TaxID=3029061 RepID=A0ABY8NAG1_9GAMM|nr:DUF4153 domain-containing protein [Microbulbifer bruguierae]WGL15409.1 DUF4153 domain-containing protein [Microbulbifer bruguierae]